MDDINKIGTLGLLGIMMICASLAFNAGKDVKKKSKQKRVQTTVQKQIAKTPATKTNDYMVVRLKKSEYELLKKMIESERNRQR